MLKHHQRNNPRQYRTKFFDKKKLEEYLEILWYYQEQENTNMKKLLSDMIPTYDPSITVILKEKGFVTETADELKFTEKGHQYASQLVRSHRLAERLLTDVLNMKVDQAESGACEFEHIVIPEIVDGICTLLGHPKICPHGLSIPEGACSREARRSIKTATKSLTELNAGQEVRIAYINTRSNLWMHQLTQLGIKPGEMMKIHQTYPALVVRINSAQVALDNEVASDILVWE